MSKQTTTDFDSKLEGFMQDYVRETVTTVDAGPLIRRAIRHSYREQIKKAVAELVEECIEKVQSKKFPIGERGWCRECVNRVTREIRQRFRGRGIEIK